MDMIPRNDYGERCQFDAYCKLVLYHEAIDYLREMQRRRVPYLIPTYKALQKSKNARKIRKTEDVQTTSVSSFGFSTFKAPSMAPSTIGKYCSGQSFNFCPTRWRSSLSSRMTSGLKIEQYIRA
jgi:hypothetical protein